MAICLIQVAFSSLDFADFVGFACWNCIAHVTSCWATLYGETFDYLTLHTSCIHCIHYPKLPCGQFPLQVFAFASYFERTSSAVGTKPRAVCTNDFVNPEKIWEAKSGCCLLPADSAFYLQVCQWRGGTDAVLCRISVKGKKYNLGNVRETNPKQS